MFLLAALPAAAGLTDLNNPGPALTSVQIRQRYPWNGLVDVNVSFEGKSGETYRIELSATDKAGGTNLVVSTAWLETAPGVVGNPVTVPAPGTHRLVWNAGADLPAGFVADRVTVTAKLLNPIWSFASIPEIDPDDEWAPETVYHDVQTVAAYGEIEDHEPTVRCLTDEWNLEASLGANVVFSGSSMGLRVDKGTMVSWGAAHPISLWSWSDTTNRFRLVNIDYETGHVASRNPTTYADPLEADVRFFWLKGNDQRQYAITARNGYHAFWKSGGSEMVYSHLGNRYDADGNGSAVCAYFPNGVPFSDATSTTVPSSYDKDTRASVFFGGVAGTDRKQAVIHGGGSPGVDAGSKYSCMGNPVGRYVVPLLDGNRFFTIVCEDGREFVPQNFRWALGTFDSHGEWRYLSSQNNDGRGPDIAKSKAVAMPDGERVFLGGVGRFTNGRLRMWNGTAEGRLGAFKDFPTGHPLESWARRDVTCLLPNGKFCGVDEELGLVVVNPLTGETYVASDNPVFKKGKMGCQLLPNGKVWIIPYDCEGREFAAGTNLCGKLYEVDFGFTRSFSLSSLCSPYLKVAEGDPEPSGIKVGLDPNGGELPGIYAMYYKGENPVYGELPVPTWTGHTFLGWSTDGTVANLVAATDPVPPNGIRLKAAWDAITYKVGFYGNGADNDGAMHAQTFTYGTSQKLSKNTYVRTGYTFREWGSGSNGGGHRWADEEEVLNLSAVQDYWVSMYALWDANAYSVKFNANTTGSTGSMSNESFVFGTAKALTANAFAKAGYRFAGWARTATGAKAFNDKQTVSNLTAAAGAVVDLYALWSTNTYTVRFNKNASDATGTMANQGFTYDRASALRANSFARTGYAFSGWATSASGAKVYNDKQSVSNLTATAGGTVNLYAKWTANTYSVKFNKNATDATGSMSNESFTYGTAKALTANSFARTGYTFGGWATSATGAKVYNDKQSVSNLTATAGGTVNLYAKWTANTYSVKFNKNAADATGSMSNQAFTYGVAQTLTANAFTRTGYTFTGWSTSATGAKVYDDKQSVANLTATAGGTVNLYAAWAKETGGVYMIIDLAGGSGAACYPVSYLDDIPEGGWTDEFKTTKIVLRRIEPGSFTMGNSSYTFNQPHKVTLTKSYYIGVFECTLGQWMSVMGSKPPLTYGQHNSNTRKPVVDMSYLFIRGSSNWPTDDEVSSDSFMGTMRARTGLSVDFPTEAEWEYACRAGTTTDLNSGKNLTSSYSCPNLDEVAYYYYSPDRPMVVDDEGVYAHQVVGCYLPNNCGLYDMHGNVNEMCLDYDDEQLIFSDMVNPRGPTSHSLNRRIVRGGSSQQTGQSCTSYYRSSAYQHQYFSSTVGDLGFRLAIHLDD